VNKKLESLSNRIETRRATKRAALLVPEIKSIFLYLDKHVIIDVIFGLYWFESMN
jgi:hypothetical protein